MNSRVEAVTVAPSAGPSRSAGDWTVSGVFQRDVGRAGHGVLGSGSGKAKPCAVTEVPCDEGLSSSRKSNRNCLGQ